MGEECASCRFSDSFTHPDRVGGQMVSRQRITVSRPKRRRTWAIRPTSRPHSTPKGKKGYDRAQGRKAARDEKDDE